MIFYLVLEINNKNAVFTAISIVTNPDFAKIEKSRIDEYHYEPLIAKLIWSQGHKSAFVLWVDGIKKRLFITQVHGGSILIN